MKKLLGIFIICLAVQSGIAQESRSIIEGFVVHGETGEALEGANVFLVGTSIGDVTDQLGYFKIERIVPGRYEVRVQLIGYQEIPQQIHLRADESRKLVVRLEPVVIAGSEISIEGERVEDIRVDISPPSYKIEPKAVQEMAGALEDVMRSVLSLPGVLATSDFGNQFIVRGGGPDQNLILLDDVEIFNPYRNSGMPSLINPSIVRSINLYAGAYPAMYGDRLSSVLTIHTRDGTTDKWLSGKLGMNLATANFMLEGRLPFGDGSWILSNRRTYNQFFAEEYAERRTENDVALPDFEDWQGKVAFRPAPHHRLQLFGGKGRNNQDFLVEDDVGEQDAEREDFDGEDRLETTMAGGSWSYVPSETFQAKVHGSWYRNRGNSNLGGDFLPANHRTAVTIGFATEPPPVIEGGDSTFVFAHEQRFDFRKLSLGGWLVFQHGNHILETGGGVSFLENEIDSELELSNYGKAVFEALQSAPNFFGALGDSVDQQSSYERYHLYVQDKLSVLNGRAFIQPGLRLDHSALIGQSYLSPRLKLSYKIDAVTTLTAGWGIYRQTPGFEKLLDGGQVFDLLKFEDLAGLSAERAVHSIVGIQRWFGDRWHVTLEGYHKRFEDLIDQALVLVERPVAVYTAGNQTDPNAYIVRDGTGYRKLPRPVNDITGDAYGLDFRLEKRTIAVSDRFFGWLSYSLSKSMREQTFDEVRLTYPYDFDRRHSLDLVLNTRIGPHFTFGLTWRYGTGFPYTPALAVEPLVAEVVDADNPGETKPALLTDPETGAVRFVPTFGGPENINSLRYPDYRRLDLRLTYSTKMLNSNWQFYLDIINVNDRKNVLLYRSIIQTEIDTTQPIALQYRRVRAFEEPVYMYPFIPSLGISVAF